MKNLYNFMNQKKEEIDKTKKLKRMKSLEGPYHTSKGSSPISPSDELQGVCILRDHPPFSSS
jgi:hypothetical protein